MNPAPTVSVSPVGPLTMNVGQIQVFTSTASGGSGTIHYQWYVDGSAVGSDSRNFSYTAAGASHLVTCKVTDSASTPVTSAASNAVSVTVNPALIAPSIATDKASINQGNAAQLSIYRATSGGTTPYSYQWLARAPGASSYSPISGAISSSYSFATNISTAIGSWSFELQVTDAVSSVVTSSAVSVMVNIPPLDHFIFSSVGTQTAGTSFSITITAKDASGHTLTNFDGTNTLNVSNGTINPSTVVFSKGVWTGSVKVTGAGSGVTLFTTGSGMSGTSNSFIVNSGILNSFTFNTVTSPQSTGSAFSITVTAKDTYGNTVTSYTGAPSLTYSAGQISPGIMNAFVNGVGSTSVTLTGSGSDVTITATEGTYSGVSNSFTVTLAEPSSTPNPTTTGPTPTPKTNPTATPTSTEAPSPTPTPIVTTVIATTDSGAKVNLFISGNMSGFDVSNVTIAANQSATTTTVSFTVNRAIGSVGFSNMTIPKTAVPYGTNPVILIDGQQSIDQGFTQDANNFYVWYTVQFNTHQVKIQFAASSILQNTFFGSMLAIGITVPEIILIYAVIAVRRLNRKPENA